MALVCHTDLVASEHLLSLDSIPDPPNFLMMQLKAHCWRGASRHPGGKPLPPSDTNSWFLERGDTPVLFPTFHNTPQVQKTGKELPLPLVNSVWVCYMEANCVLLPELFLHTEFGSGVESEPGAHPTCTTLSGFMGGAPDPDEENTHLFAKTSQSLGACVNKSN